MGRGQRVIRGVVATVVCLILFCALGGMFAIQRFTSAAQTVPEWRRRAAKQGLAVNLDDLRPKDLSHNAAPHYAKGEFELAASEPICWFEPADPSARRFYAFRYLQNAFESLVRHDPQSAIKVLRHAEVTPFREAYRIRLLGEEALLKSLPKDRALAVAAELGPIPNPAQALRGELVRDRARLTRKWANNEPINTFVPPEFIEARVLELWCKHHKAIKEAKGPEEVQSRLEEFDSAIRGHRFISRFMRSGYSEIGEAYAQLAETRARLLDDAAAQQVLEH